MSILPNTEETLSHAPAADSTASAGRSAWPRITSKARRYAVKELARRAGVSKEFFQQWTIESTGDHTTVSFGSGANGSVRFAHTNAKKLDGIGRTPVAKASWLDKPPNCEPDLLVPFCDSNSDIRAPLYQRAPNGVLICSMDVLASFLFTLSRVEESLCRTLDEHSRFPASASVAVSHGFLERPYLDEHGLAFQQALSSILPSWQPSPPVLKFKLTHDIDSVGIPFLARTSLGHTLARRRPFATLQDLFSQASGVLPAELAQVLRLAEISRSRGLFSAFYWKGSPSSPYDTGYDPTHRKVQRVIEKLREYGFELGVHPGYETFGNRAKLAGEVENLRRALGVNHPGGRQHYLRWSADTWLDWEACGLSYDSSLGFADAFGFRAGTGVPYRPWCFREDRELNLIEIPLILMDCTPVKYMKLRREEAMPRIKALIERMRNTGGVFTMLWHNTPLMDPDYANWYEPILDLLAGAQNFGVPPIAEELW